MNGIDVIILGAGPGSRMNPWTLTCPKVLIKIAGRPILDHHIEKLDDARRIVVTAYHLREKMEEWLVQTRRLHPDVELFREAELLETGDACREVVLRYGMDRAVILYGDTWFDQRIYGDIPRLYADDRNYIFCENPRDYANGLIKYDCDTHCIDQIAEAGGIPEANGRNFGIMILNRDVLESAHGDLMKDVMAHRHDLWAHPVEPPGIDIGTFENYVTLAFEQATGRSIDKDVVEAARVIMQGGYTSGILEAVNGLR